MADPPTTTPRVKTVQAQARRALTLAATFALAAAAMMFVPHRTGTVRDVLIDWAGIALGVLFWRVLASGGRKPPVA